MPIPMKSMFQRARRSYVWAVCLAILCLTVPPAVRGQAGSTSTPAVFNVTSLGGSTRAPHDRRGPREVAKRSAPFASVAVAAPARSALAATTASFFVVDAVGNLGTVDVAAGTSKLIGNTGVTLTDL